MASLLPGMGLYDIIATGLVDRRETLRKTSGTNPQIEVLVDDPWVASVSCDLNVRSHEIRSCSYEIRREVVTPENLAILANAISSLDAALVPQPETELWGSPGRYEVEFGEDGKYPHVKLFHQTSSKPNAWRAAVLFCYGAPHPERCARLARRFATLDLPPPR